jgi:hypothetical protein
MLLWTPVLNNYDKVRFIRDGRFLDSKGVHPDRYWVGPSDTMPARATPECSVVIGYDAGGYNDRKIGATILFLMGGRSVTVASSLGNATSFLMEVFDEPSLLQRAGATDPDATAEEALRHFDLDPAGIIRSDVGAYEPDTYLAPDGGEWQLYLVEPYGQIVRIARSAQPAPLACWHAAGEESLRSNLGERIAAFIPSDAAAIVRG